MAENEQPAGSQTGQPAFHEPSGKLHKTGVFLSDRKCGRVAGSRSRSYFAKGCFQKRLIVFDQNGRCGVAV